MVDRLRAKQVSNLFPSCLPLLYRENGNVGFAEGTLLPHCLMADCSTPPTTSPRHNLVVEPVPRTIAILALILKPYWSAVGRAGTGRGWSLDS